MAEELFIPQLGQTVEEVTIIQWVLEDGATVEHGQEVLEVETDKAVFPIEANAKGTLHIGPYKKGDTVQVLTVVAIIGKPEEKFELKNPEGGDKPPDALPTGIAVPQKELTGIENVSLGMSGGHIFASPRARRLAREKSIALTEIAPTGGKGIRIIESDVIAYLSRQPKITPVARKMAEEAGIDVTNMKGSGPGGAITRADLFQGFKKSSEAVKSDAVKKIPLPEVDILGQVPLTGVRGIIAERMAISVQSTAKVTLMAEVDATELVKIRTRLANQVAKEWGFKPGYNELLAKITADALRQFPYMNARMAGNFIEHLANINIGIAVDSERGLVVPVIRDVDKKDLHTVGKEFQDLVDRALQGRSLPDDLSAGTFTITNLGPYEIEGFTPVINLPEAAILGIGRITAKPAVLNGEVVPRDMCTLSLTFDHRLIDGGPAARFLQAIKNAIEGVNHWIADGH